MRVGFSKPTHLNRRSDALRGLGASLLAALAIAGRAAPAGAEPAAETKAVPACDGPSNAAAASAWSDLGGAEGRLGCPTAAASATIVSSHGTAAAVVAFGDRGVLVLPTSGPAAGRAVAIFGCAFRLWTQMGGPGGRLGDPLADAVNTPDGWIQTFEGGRLITTRAYDDCRIED